MSTAPPTNPFSPPAAPSLPYDLLRLIAIDAAGDAVEQEEREVARAVSLVCRDLRDIGQGSLWTTLTVPRRDVHEKLERGGGKRLAGMVRRLRWDKQEKRANGDGELEDPHAGVDLKAAFSFFLRFLQSSETLSAVEIVDLNEGDLLEAFTALQTSASRSNISALALGGSLPFPPPSAAVAPSFDEYDLLRFLHLFPSLSSFTGDLCRVSPPAPGIPTIPLPPLHLRHLTLGSKHECPDDVLTPSSPWHLFLHSLEPTALHSVVLQRTPEHDGWLRAVGNPTFTHLESLTVISAYPTVASCFPLLSRTITRLPALTHLRVEDSAEVGLNSDECVLAFLHLLRTLPNSLRRLEFVFKSSDYVVEDYLPTSSHPTLERVLCKDGTYETVFERRDGRWQQESHE